MHVDDMNEAVATAVGEKSAILNSEINPRRAVFSPMRDD